MQHDKPGTGPFTHRSFRDEVLSSDDILGVQAL